MVRQELVEQEKWISPAHFNRALALYQVLPGPEAHELCVYFGMVARGRMGGFLAGLGFMLPGLLLMLGACWLYTHAGLQSPATLAVFTTVQAAVTALILRGAWRIGQHALTQRSLFALALGAALAQAFSVPFGLTLLWAGLTALFLSQGRTLPALLLTAATAAAALTWGVLLANGGPAPLAPQAPTALREAPSLLALLGSGLRTGLLTFGGAYTAIPFLQHDAVVRGAWMSNAQFLDGIALGGVLPAPLIIFGTFVGYLGGGFPGALAVTAGIFAPAFGFTLLAHHPLERLMHHPRARVLLEGITAGVVGLIATTTLGLMATTLRDIPTVLVFAAAALFLFRSKARLAPMYALLGAALVGGLRHLLPLL
jgi:chromate transporter